ncbi:MAG: hypothetical protein JWO72_3284 [Caulobacteraceae bacterium]|jgi:hypothetical protein|nr:hypothetical protein [Caulobacteraceae bacterium]
MFHAIQVWFAATPPAAIVRDVVWFKALLESAHILADGLVLFSVGMICVRVARASSPDAAAEAARRFAPWVWGALAVAVSTGLVLLTGAGRRGLDNPMFQIKLAALLSAALVTGGLQLSLARDAGFWTVNPRRRAAAAMLGPLCFLLWLATVFAGRLLAYSTAFFEPRY